VDFLSPYPRKATNKKLNTKPAKILAVRKIQSDTTPNEPFLPILLLNDKNTTQ
jgi:hypothetical protein